MNRFMLRLGRDYTVRFGSDTVNHYLLSTPHQARDNILLPRLLLSSLSICDLENRYSDSDTYRISFV
jgi:hypothetical protein